MISFRFSGLNELFRSFDEAGKKDMYDDIIKQTGEKAVKYAKMYAPELTGKMMKGIQGEIRGNSFILECLVPWAIFNEYGSIYMKVGTPNSPLAVRSGSGKYAFRPFMRPAIYRAMGELPELFGKKWARIWK